MCPACNPGASRPQSHLRLVLKNGQHSADSISTVTAASFDISGPTETTPAGTVLAPLGMRLDSIKRGDTVQVVAVDGDDTSGTDPIRERLGACGVWAGAEIECLAAAPFGGPLLFRIHGYRLALRRSEAARVVVTCQDDSGAVA